MKHSIKTLFCILAFVSLSWAETWEDTITVGLEGYLGTKHFAFENKTIVVPSDSDSSDVYMYVTCLASTGDGSCFYYLKMYGKSQNSYIWSVKDTLGLKFKEVLDLSDTIFFSESARSQEVKPSVYGPEQYFILLLGSGKYAFCHGTIVDSIYYLTLPIVDSILIETMPLACQVQEDGTPTFDSIPQYKEPPLALPPLRQSTMQKQGASAPYRVNGTTAGTSTATGIRVGKHTAIRKQAK